jgi:hypothetical protein
MILEDFTRIEIGTSIEVKVFLSTKTIERIAADEYAVHSYIDGWSIEYMNQEELKQYLIKRRLIK